MREGGGEGVSEGEYMCVYVFQEVPLQNEMAIIGYVRVCTKLGGHLLMNGLYDCR